MTKNNSHEFDRDELRERFGELLADVQLLEQAAAALHQDLTERAQSQAVITETVGTLKTGIVELSADAADVQRFLDGEADEADEAGTDGDGNGAAANEAAPRRSRKRARSSARKKR